MRHCCSSTEEAKVLFAVKTVVKSSLLYCVSHTLFIRSFGGSEDYDLDEENFELEEDEDFNED